MTRFAAIDFETANNDRDSACALGVVIVENGQIVERLYEVIRPPTSEMLYTHIHGLTWDDVKGAQRFDVVWKEMAKALKGIEFLAAHNAPFDKKVLVACCETYGLASPEHHFVCTVKLARSQWDLFPTKLPDVCRFLGLKLRHHQADSDAEACARIVMAALEEGWKYNR
jgi:DNA polymerase-3 subunit epsilon